MEKNEALLVLLDIRESLKDGKEKALKTIDLYEKNLKISINEKIQKLVQKQKEYREKFGEDDKRTLRLNKIIDREICRIYNN